jgi:hypothetical protein
VTDDVTPFCLGVTFFPFSGLPETDMALLANFLTNSVSTSSVNVKLSKEIINVKLKKISKDFQKWYYISYIRLN